MDAGRHPLIDVVTNAEVTGCRGRSGNFRVRIRKHPRYKELVKRMEAGT